MRFDGYRYKIGTSLAGMTIKALAGRGGNGEIYIVEDMTGQYFALKYCYASNTMEIDSIRRFRQVRATSHVIQIYQAGDLGGDGAFCYVMQVADNVLSFPAYKPDSLESRLKACGRLTARETIIIMKELLEGVHAIHEAGFVHRDLKPENILFINGCPCIADFGLLCPIGTDVDVAGTAGYYPEEWLNDSHRSASCLQDYYALGKIMYALWSGFDGAEYPKLPSDCDLKEFSFVHSCYERLCAVSSSQPHDLFSEAMGLLKQAEQSLSPSVTPCSRKTSRMAMYTGCAAVLSLMVYFCMRLSSQPLQQEQSVFEEPLFLSAVEMDLYNQCIDPERNPLIQEFFDLYVQESRYSRENLPATMLNQLERQKERIQNDKHFRLYALSNDIKRHLHNHNETGYVKARDQARSLVREILSSSAANDKRNME